MQNNSQKTVMVGLSGGVDSSVSAALLVEQGFKVIGLYMKNWQETEAEKALVDGKKGCTAEEDFKDVVAVCDHLNIPYYTIDFVEEYWQNVFAPALEVFSRGETPNPDILCNSEIKFKRFFQKAKDLGADFVATGHYCQLRKDPVSEETLLVKGFDPGKDQSYFLSAVSSHILKDVLFPIGDWPKSKVRAYAKEKKIPVHSKKDSTGICFIGERQFDQFLGNYIAEKVGNFVDDKGQVVGQHKGVPFYTIGQRKGLGLGGAGEPWFVVSKDLEKNIVYVVRGGNEACLFHHGLWAHSLSFVSGREEFFAGMKLTGKIRYRQQDQELEILSFAEGKVHLRFVEPQRAITPGQYIVFYQGDVCLGGGVIGGGLNPL
jgi:tRNA-specific 2-thiouridylase